MPFTHLADSAHRCEAPTQRDDGSKLQVGDEWQCDKRLSDQFSLCGKLYRWTASSDQREPDSYWKPIIHSERSDR